MKWSRWKRKLSETEEWRREERSIRESVYWGFLWREFMKEFFSSEKEVMLDIGCGSGGYLVPITKDKGYIGIGLDPLIETSLRILKKRIKKQGLEAYVIRGVGEYVPLKNESIKTIVITATLDHVAQVDKVIKDSRRVLQNNGYIFILQSLSQKKIVNANDRTHLRKFTEREVYNMLNRNNFEIVKVKLLYSPRPRKVFGRTLIFIPSLFNFIGKLFGGVPTQIIVLARIKKEN